jgi:phosphatidylglycerophosphate synthase
MRQYSVGEGLSVWILIEPGQPAIKVWGLPVVERLRRALYAAGVPSERIGVGPACEVSSQGSRLLIFRSDYVFDERLVRAMVASENTVLVSSRTPSDRGEAVAVHVEGSGLGVALQLLRGEESPERVVREAGLQFVGPADLVPAYTPSLRKADPPYLLPVWPERVAEIESRIFAASYKGVTDLVTKWVWPLPARTVTRCLARAGIHPNVVTLLSWGLVALAALLFAQGRFGLGLAVAWLMTFLDTVDGKLARVTLTSSRAGHALDHSLDLLHPPFWYLAWAVGLPRGTVWLGPAAAVTVGGYVVGRLIEGIFLLAFKMEIHCWRPIDSHFRTVTARRNPNLILLTAGTLANRPDLGLVLVAVWTACSIGFHTVRLAQAFIERWRGRPVRTWQEEMEGVCEAAGSAPNSSRSLA